MTEYKITKKQMQFLKKLTKKQMQFLKFFYFNDDFWNGTL